MTVRFGSKADIPFADDSVLNKSGGTLAVSSTQAQKLFLGRLLFLSINDHNNSALNAVSRFCYR
jgi:hypothetical protein